MSTPTRRLYQVSGHAIIAQLHFLDEGYGLLEAVSERKRMDEVGVAVGPDGSVTILPDTIITLEGIRYAIVEWALHFTQEGWGDEMGVGHIVDTGDEIYPTLFFHLILRPIP